MGGYNTKEISMRETFIISQSIRKNLYEPSQQLPRTITFDVATEKTIQKYETAIKKDIKDGMRYLEIARKWHIGLKYYKELGGKTYKR